MNPENNESDNDVREPIPSNFDILIDDEYEFNDNPIATESDLEKIIQQSINEFRFLQEQEEERNISIIIETEWKERLTKFVTTKKQLNRIMLIDNINSTIYNLLLNVIELYESGIINVYNVSHEEHSNIFKIIKTIRLPSHEVESLNKIISIE